jgi:hypothetical protein
MVPTQLSEFIIPFAYLMPESERRLKEDRPKGKYPHRLAPSIAEMGGNRPYKIATRFYERRLRRHKNQLKAMLGKASQKSEHRL